MKRPNGYWTLKRCLEEAVKYLTRSEFKQNSSSAYIIAQRNGWIEECTKHMTQLHKPAGHWNLETCKAEAKKYKTRAEWAEKSSTSYQKALKYGWLNTINSNFSFLLSSKTLEKLSIGSLILLQKRINSELKKRNSK